MVAQRNRSESMVNSMRNRAFAPEPGGARRSESPSFRVMTHSFVFGAAGQPVLVAVHALAPRQGETAAVAHFANGQTELRCPSVTE